MSAKKNCRLITPKDAQRVLDRSIQTARRKLDEIKFHFNKKDWQPITLKEFCDFFGFDMEDVCEILGWD